MENTRFSQQTIRKHIIIASQSQNIKILQTTGVYSVRTLCTVNRQEVYKYINSWDVMYIIFLIYLVVAPAGYGFVAG